MNSEYDRLVFENNAMKQTIRELRKTLRGYACGCDDKCLAKLGSICGEAANKTLSSVGGTPDDHPPGPKSSPRPPNRPREVA